MNDRVRAIVEQARQLTPEERLEAEFPGEAGDGTPEEIEAAWLQEVARRAARADAGETIFVDAAEVPAKARQRIQ